MPPAADTELGYAPPTVRQFSVFLDNKVGKLLELLRDLREDLEAGRCYLPLREYAAIELAPERVLAWQPADSCAEFIRAQCRRADEHYRRSEPLDRMIDPACLPTLWAMTEIYRGILHRIEAGPHVVVHGRARLSSLRKAWIAWRASRMPRGAPLA